MNPKNLRGTLDAAIALQHGGKLEDAARIYAQACRSAPQVFDVWYLAGTLAFQQGRLTEAIDFLNRARRLDPNSAPCKLFLGMALADAGQHAEAEKPLRAALEKLPRQPDAWLNLARSLRALGRPVEEAITWLRRAAEFQPDRAETQEQLGELLVMTEGLAAAEPHFRRAVELAPGLVCAWTNLGLALLELPGRLSEAVDCLERAVQIDSANVEARAGRALARLCAYRQAEADLDYGVALTLQPNNPRILSARAMVSNYLAGRSRAAVFALHTEFGRCFGGVSAVVGGGTPERGRRLRVGFVSPDLRTHPVACFLEPLLRHFDRNGFELMLYHNHARVDATSDRLRQLAGKWCNLNGLSDDAAEIIIRRDAPDILVDLAGHSSGNRLPLFARRLAPVQVTYLGYPNTTGLAAMDYRFTDALTDPPGAADRFATEELVRFAPAAWAFDPPSDAPQPGSTPGKAGTPVTFGSFNNFTKVTDEMLRVWARLLAQVPGSRLVLKSRYFEEPLVSGSVRMRLRAAGLADERVDLLPPFATREAHLGAYAQVDIALDTFPYHGTTTTCEALWMGLPVVVLAGDCHAARVGVSLLHAVGRSEWLAGDVDQYVAIAVKLANDPSGRRTLRQSLRDEMRHSPLLDHAGQAARFGTALRECWGNWCQRQNAAPLNAAVTRDVVLLA